MNTAEEMYNACLQLHNEMDIEIMAAAVADYKPAEVAAEKIKKNKTDISLQLDKNKRYSCNIRCNKKIRRSFWQVLHWKQIMKKQMRLIN